MLLYPEALNQHPLTLDIRTLTHEMLLLIIWLPVAGIAFLMTLWGLMIYKSFKGRVSLEVALKASLRIAIAVYLFLPLYQVPFFLFHRSNDAAATAGICLDAVVLVVGIIAAARAVKHTQNPVISV